MSKTSAEESEPVVYYENCLRKQEGVNTWILYWVVIRDRWIQFFHNEEDRHSNGELVKTFELTPNTQCTLVKRKKRRFPFSVSNGLVVYYVKCDTELERYHWIFSLLTSSLGKPKTTLPSHIPDSMVEKEVFKRKEKREKEKETVDVSKNEVPKPASDYHAKRRQKYADRNEKRHLRKEAKRNRKLEERRLSENQMSTSMPLPSEGRLSDYRRVSEGRSSELHRSQKIQLGDQNVPFRRNSDMFKIKSLQPTVNRNFGKSGEGRNNDDGRQRSEDSNKSIKVNVVMHDNGRTSINNVSDNLGYDVSDHEDDDDDDDDEDINGFTRIDVISCRANVLPNVVTSDDDSDADSTANTSVTSPNSLLFTDLPDDPSDMLDMSSGIPVIIHEQQGLGVPYENTPFVSSKKDYPRSPMAQRPVTRSATTRRPLTSLEIPSSPARPRSATSLSPTQTMSSSLTNALLSPRPSRAINHQPLNHLTTLQNPSSSLANALLSPRPTQRAVTLKALGSLDLPGSTVNLSTTPKPLTNFSRFLAS